MKIVFYEMSEEDRMLQDEWHLATSGSESQEQLKTLIQDHALIDNPKVAYTPHIAFFTTEAKHEILAATVENISGFLGENAQNAITQWIRKLIARYLIYLVNLTPQNKKEVSKTLAGLRQRATVLGSRSSTAAQQRDQEDH